MRIAFYAPLKAPTHSTPSGDRRVARLLIDALRLAGHTVELASDLRSFDGVGDLARQQALQREGLAAARSLIDQWQGALAVDRPALWFTYHLYYKAPDWIGPAVCRALGIPYVVVEASHAAKRLTGPWAMGEEAVMAAIRQADLLLCPTAHDVAGLRIAAHAATRIERLPPFLDPAPYRRAARKRSLLRTRWQRAQALPSTQLWLVVSAMMRPGDKLASYTVLAQALPLLLDLPWRLLVAGDGEARAQVQAMLTHAAPDRVSYLGACDARTMAALYAAADLCIWPAVNEAYGMAMLEAQAAGTAVVSCATRGVPDVVQDGVTGLLAPAIDAEQLAACARSLLSDPQRCAAMGRAAAQFVANERSLLQAAAHLRSLLAPWEPGAVRAAVAAPAQAVGAAPDTAGVPWA
ncbi:MAG: glycosyltransferase family 4 protein [Burkholderiaceae bacterium]